jgi:hypothetical protein
VVKRLSYWLETIKRGVPTVTDRLGVGTLVFGGSLLGLLDVLSLPWALLVVAGGLGWAVLEGAAQMGTERDRALEAAPDDNKDPLVTSLSDAADEMRGIASEIRDLRKDPIGHVQWQHYELLKRQFAKVNEEVLRALQKDQRGRQLRHYYMLSPGWLAPEVTRLGEDALPHLDRTISYALGQVEYVIGILDRSLPVTFTWTAQPDDDTADYPVYRFEVVSRVDYDLLMDDIGVVIECEGHERWHHARVTYPAGEQPVVIKGRGVVRATLSFSDETAGEYAGKQTTERAYVEIAGRDTIVQVAHERAA